MIPSQSTASDKSKMILCYSVDYMLHQNTIFGCLSKIRFFLNALNWKKPYTFFINSFLSNLFLYKTTRKDLEIWRRFLDYAIKIWSFWSELIVADNLKYCRFLIVVRPLSIFNNQTLEGIKVHQGGWSA